MVCACMFPSVKHGGGVIVWRSFAGCTVGDLVTIQETPSQHGYHSILQQHTIPSGLCFVSPSCVFERDNNPKHTSMQFDQKEE